MKRSLAFLAGLAAMATAVTANAVDDLLPLADDFGNAASIAAWQRVYQQEMTGADQLEIFDINTTQAGKLVMEPHTSTWYNEYRGELTFKNVTGDFVITTDVVSTNRAGTAAPSSNYSLGGLMIRTPRTPPVGCSSMDENYVFLSIGAGNTPGTYQFEVKTTVNSMSTLIIVATGGINHATIQIARIGNYVITLRQFPGGPWTVHHRYVRMDFPATLQAGMTTYTDFANTSTYTPCYQNSHVLLTGNPDLVSAFDYVCFRRPQVPPAFQGLDLSNPAVVSDAQLLTFLGANAMGTPAPTAGNSGPVCVGQDVTLTASTVDGATYSWTGPNGYTSTQQNPVLTGVTAAQTGDYSVVAMTGCGASSPSMTTVTVNADASTPAVTPPGDATSTQTACD